MKANRPWTLQDLLNSSSYNWSGAGGPVQKGRPLGGHQQEEEKVFTDARGQRYLRRRGAIIKLPMGGL